VRTAPSVSLTVDALGGGHGKIGAIVTGRRIHLNADGEPDAIACIRSF
jgi:hypothetical protein